MGTHQYRKYAITPLERYRMQCGYEMQEYADKAEISKAMVNRIEKEQAVRHATLAKYLKPLGINMNDTSTFPSGFQIIDVEDKVRVQLTPQQ